MASFINEELFARRLRDVLNEEMHRAAEPILQKAVQDMETEMRKRLAAMLVSLVERSYTLERKAQEIVVRVRLGESDAH